MLSGWAGSAAAASSTECTKIGVCYCINADLKPVIESKIAHFRELAAQHRQAGKAVGYLSVPLSPAGGGYMNLNREVADSAKASIEKRFGADFVWVLNPAMPDADIPKGTGADYMLMWTTLLEGRDGFGEDFDFVYFVGPQDFSRVLGLDGSNLGDYEGKIETFEADGSFRRAVAQWPNELSPPGAYHLLGLVYDRSGKELARVAPRMVSVNMQPGY